MARPELTFKKEDAVRIWHPVRRYFWFQIGLAILFGLLFVHQLFNELLHNRAAPDLLVGGGFFAVLFFGLALWTRYRKGPTAVATACGLILDPLAHPHRLVWWDEIRGFRIHHIERSPVLVILLADRDAVYDRFDRAWYERDIIGGGTLVISAENLGPRPDEALCELEQMREEFTPLIREQLAKYARST